jgi:hypothetical protein
VPWAVTLLGVTGAIAFARLAFLLPYALFGAFALLAVGFWLAYRRPRACETAACSTASRRALQVIVWVAAIVVGALSFVALTAQVTLY